MSDYVIEKDIPVPKKTGWNGGWKGPVRRCLEALDVGDSFFVTLTRAGIYAAAATAAKGTGFKFTVRQVEGGFRVWRTK